jgi:hypothetical protein
VRKPQEQDVELPVGVIEFRTEAGQAYLTLDADRRWHCPKSEAIARTVSTLFRREDDGRASGAYGRDMINEALKLLRPLGASLVYLRPDPIDAGRQDDPDCAEWLAATKRQPPPEALAAIEAAQAARAG